MYSYDRKKVGRRNTAEAIEGLQEAITGATEAVEIATAFIRGKGDLFRFLQLDPDLSEAKSFLRAASRIAQELPATATAVDQLDDALDAYARTTRRGMPRNREEIGPSDLDPKMLQTFQLRAKPLAKKLKLLEMLAKDAPANFDIDDPYESPRVAALNELATQMGDLSTTIMFDATELIDLLEGIEDKLIELINRGPE
jgi:hypothetical protein